MICEGCKFANWERTSNGRLHPSGMGKCEWQKTFRVAGSYTGSIGHAYGGPLVAWGSTICRKKGDEFPDRCDVFQRAEP